jgi:hypothetical protein
VGGGELLLDVTSLRRAPFAVRVVWTAGNRVGLERLQGTSEQDASWSELIERAARAVEAEAEVKIAS